ncbi:MAG: uracil-DNA glycosylase, partial [Clostridium sp.]|nr:uracil-DNA glycosylase [Clostridium sp.]
KGVYIMPIFHPAALLRDESKKPLFWEDLKEIKKKYEEIK